MKGKPKNNFREFILKSKKVNINIKEKKKYTKNQNFHNIFKSLIIIYKGLYFVIILNQEEKLFVKIKMIKNIL